MNRKIRKSAPPFGNRFGLPQRADLGLGKTDFRQQRLLKGFVVGRACYNGLSEWRGGNEELA